MNLDELLNRCEELDQKATPGPWTAEEKWGECMGVATELAATATIHSHGTKSWSRYVAQPANGHSCVITSDAHRNMQLIAESRTLLPILTAIVRVQREALEDIRHMLYGNEVKPIYAEQKAAKALATAERLARGDGK